MVSIDVYIYQLISLLNVINAEYEEYTADIRKMVNMYEQLY